MSCDVAVSSKKSLKIPSIAIKSSKTNDFSFNRVLPKPSGDPPKAVWITVGILFGWMLRSLFLYRASYLFCNTVVQCQEHRSHGWLSTPLSKFLTRQTSCWSDTVVVTARCHLLVVPTMWWTWHLKTARRHNADTRQTVWQHKTPGLDAKKSSLPPVFSSPFAGSLVHTAAKMSTSIARLLAE